MKYTAGIIVDRKHVMNGVNRLKEIHLGSFFDSKIIRNIIGNLEELNFEIKLITWSDFVESSPDDFDVIVVTQWILNGERGRSIEKVSNKLKLEKIKHFISSGVSFILTHHFYPDREVFGKLLDINFLDLGERGYFANKSTIQVHGEGYELIQNVNNLLNIYSTQLGSDEFTYVIKPNSKFSTLIEKIPKKGHPNRFILFGYQQLNARSAIFIIDIHNIGAVESHSKLFDVLFHNTLQFIIGDGKILETIKNDIASNTEEDSDSKEKEGAKKQVLVNKYERNPKLRYQAIKIHGLTCMACNFNFSESYGNHGSDYIEVHHLKPLSTVKEETDINPKTDMIVLCSNCHRMVHRKMNSPLSLKELKNIINKSAVSRI